MWSTPCFNAWVMPSMISGPMNMPAPTDARNWLAKKSCGRSWLVRLWSSRAALPSSRIAISSCGISRLGPKVNELAAMPVTTPARITANNGRI